jgi:hypothetical protein
VELFVFLTNANNDALFVDVNKYARQRYLFIVKVARYSTK